MKGDEVVEAQHHARYFPLLGNSGIAEFNVSDVLVMDMHDRLALRSPGELSMRGAVSYSHGKKGRIEVGRRRHDVQVTTKQHT